MKAAIAQITLHDPPPLVALVTHIVGPTRPLQLFPLVILVCRIVSRDDAVALPTLGALALLAPLARSRPLLGPLGALGSLGPLGALGGRSGSRSWWFLLKTSIACFALLGRA